MWYLLTTLTGCIFLYSLVRYYMGVVTFYRELEQVVWLMPPGWKLLPLLPFWGKQALESAIQDVVYASRLRFQAIEEARFHHTMPPLRGGEYLLLFEEYAMEKVVGARLEVLDRRKDIEHLVTLEQQGQVLWLHRSLRQRGVVAVFHGDGQDVEMVSPGKSVEVESGARVVVETTEFRVVRLPLLALKKKESDGAPCVPSDKPCFLDEKRQVKVERREGKCVISVSRGVKVKYYSIIPAGSESSREPFQEEKRQKNEGVLYLQLQPGDKIIVGEIEWIVAYV